MRLPDAAPIQPNARHVTGRKRALETRRPFGREPGAFKSVTPPQPVPRPQPDTIRDRSEFGIDPETDADSIVKEAPWAHDPKGEIVGDPGLLNPWGTGPGTGYGSGIAGLNWRNI